MNFFTYYQIYAAIMSALPILAQLAAAILLIRDRSIGPKLMIAGSAMSLALVAVTWFSVATGYFTRVGTGYQKIFAFSALGMLGNLTFCAGLLIFALQVRGRGDRIAELEAILASKMDDEHFSPRPPGA